MIVGDPRVFAIESGIQEAYTRPGLCALGFFVIHVAGNRYGVREPDASLLANSIDEVQRRIAHRGTHTAPFAREPEPGKIADSFRDAVFANDPRAEYLGIPLDDFRDVVYSNRIVWAPDGDECFDDGSYVLHLDIQDQVRLIAFKCSESHHHDPSTLRDVWMEAEIFYGVLQHWSRAFEREWVSLPKREV